MSLSYQCPYCGTKTLVEDQFAGKSGPCANCGKLITIPFHAPGETPTQESSAAGSQAARSGGSFLLVALVLLGGMLVMGALSVMLLVFVAPAVNQSRISAMNLETTSNLQQIAAAMQAYADEHGTYPPAYVADAAGQPMHSWRVLLLPYLGYSQIYEEYNFDEPWDSKGNLNLQFQMPVVFACEADADAALLYCTSYLVVTGDETMFPGAEGRKLEEIRDGVANTVLVVESHNSGITWTEPRDLSFDQMTWSVNGAVGRDIRTDNPSGAVHVITADNVTHALDGAVSQDQLRGILTVDGGEAIPWSEMEEQ